MRYICFGFFYLILSLNSFSCYGFQFQHKVKNGGTYHLFSASIQSLEQNMGIGSARFEQAYEAVLKVVNVDDKGTAEFKGEHRYSSKLLGVKEAFKLNDDASYKSHFKRSLSGVVEILMPHSFYPTVRGVPYFLNKDIKPSFKWSGVGAEIQDFHQIGYKDPFIVPFEANYTYLGDLNVSDQKLKVLYKRYQKYLFDIDKDLKSLEYLIKSQGLKKISVQGSKNIALILVRYYVNYKDKEYSMQTARIKSQGAVPVENAKGYYYGIIFWDKDKDLESFTIGEYNFIYRWQNGDIRHWHGKEYDKMQILNNDKKAVEKIEKQAKEELKQDKNIEVEKENKDIKLTLGDLLFHFNKTNLRKEVLETLTKVAKLLKENPATLIRIEGFSDDIGSKKVKKKISEGRAAAVANFLISHNIEPTRVSYIGRSDSNPRVPNNSKENRKKNRRVEIRIITQ